MKEIWKDVAGFNGKVQVSNTGKVARIKRGERIIAKQFDMGHGYCAVNLTNETGPRHYYAHRLVAAAFIENPKEKPFVNHIDGNKKNNCVDNLEWATAAENTQHAKRTGLIDLEYNRKRYAIGYDEYCKRNKIGKYNPKYQNITADLSSAGASESDR